jgi:hypothetical protein
MSSILIGALVVALFILPFYLAGKSSNNDKKHLKRALNKIAEEHKCKLSQADYLSDTAIGLDENTNHLFFIHSFNGNETVQHLLLKEYKNCTVKNFSRNIKFRETDYRAIDKLELEFTPKDKGKAVVLFEFFNSEGSKLHTDELALAEKWTVIANKRVRNQA